MNLEKINANYQELVQDALIQKLSGVASIKNSSEIVCDGNAISLSTTVELIDNSCVESVVRIYHRNGALKKEMACKNGVADGLCTLWYSSGNLMCKAEFKDGVLNGPFTVFGSSGGRLRDGIYVNGLIHGKCMVKHDDDGEDPRNVVKTLKNHNARGNINLSVVGSYSIREYKNGKLNGLYITYDDDGDEIFRTRLRNGK
jgi:antitoxin component YwqK of YwqJK toxin-antitoxin module